MSERPIAVGDLVMVVHVHCEKEARHYGRIYRVTDIAPARRFAACHDKSINITDGRLLAAGMFNGKKAFHPVAWLKRINPPPISQSIETRDLMNIEA